MTTNPREPAYCGGCPFLIVGERRDFYPGGYDYTCGVTGEWIGFRDRRLMKCLPVIQDQTERTTDHANAS